MSISILLKFNFKLSIIIFFIFFILSCQIKAQSFSHPEGVFCSCGPTLATGAGSVAKDISSKSFVKGILVRIGWDLLEPSDNHYNWVQLDTQIQRARSYGKKVSLGIVNGTYAPSWLYSLGVQPVVVNATHDTIPLPWDSIYLVKWTELIAEVGNRYKNDTTIVLIHMTNSTANGFEFFLPPPPLVNWTSYGYSDNKIISSWEKVISAFNAAFPNHYLDNDFHPVFLMTSSSNIPGDSVYQYASREIGSRYGAFSSWWTQQNTVTYPVQYSMLLNSAQRTFANIQMAQNGTRDSALFGPGGMPSALQLAVNDKICYWEIWNQDILNPGFDSILTHAKCSSITDIDKFNKREEKNIIIYPTPTHQRLYIKTLPGSLSKEFSYQIFDLPGKMVQSGKIKMNDNISQLDISKLHPGIFAIYLYTRNICQVFKIIVN